ncbi:xylose isomerase-like protein [Aspergillus granulosus]|uniref:Xylose isomerase-like protein n=1 Tax=Aspergillus granulosus TaxID=176169 RepID=A0ABR4H5W4_9EURO
MPPRGARKAALDVVPPTEDSPIKRKIDEESNLLSPRRQSKRIKSIEQFRINPSTSSPAIARESADRDTRSSQKTQSQSEESAGLIKEEFEEKEQTVDTEVKDARVKGQAITTAKATKTRTKKDQIEMQPLRARTQGLRMYVGAHVSAAGGVHNAVNNSKHIGGNAFALFLKSQRKWDNPPLQDEPRDSFLRLCKEQGYDAAKYVLPHGSYLVNLAQEDKAKSKQAYDSFVDDLHRCEALGIKLYNFHPGSANQSSLPDALVRLAKALTNALSATKTVVPVLETMCGHGSTIGGSLSEFRDLLALIPKEYHARIGICIDTCHSFAAGYDLVSPEGFQAFLKEFEDLIGIQHLRALHLNDSKAPRGSKRDLHANIGTGFLGLRAFHNVMNEPRFEGIPMILETPIDRPPSTSNGPPSTTKKPPKKPAATKTQLVPDFSVWAREIELLESLIGMDPESSKFRELEAELFEEGRETREKHMEQHKRKLEADEKKAAKGQGKQKTLMEMMTKSKTKKASKKGHDDESEDEGCQSC